MSSRATRLRHLYDLADSLSGQFGVPVEITDRDFSRMLLTDQDPSGAPVSRLLSTPATMARNAGSAAASREVVRNPGVEVLGIPGFTVIPLPTEESVRPAAYLWLIEVNGPLPSPHIEHIRIIATRTFLALSSLPDDEAFVREDAAAESSLLLETTPHDFLPRLESAAIAKGMAVGAAVFAISVLVSPRDHHYETSERLRRGMKQLLGRVRDAGAGRNAIFAATPVEAVVLVAMRQGTDADDEVERIISTVQDELFRLRAKEITHDWTIGISDPDLGWDAAYAAVWQARRAAAVGARIDWRDARIDWRDAAPYQGVSEVSPALLRRSFLTPQLERFLDDPENADLVATLRSYLRHAGNVQSVAAEQFLHRGTVYYRLRRIETLLKIDLTDGNTRLAIHLGVLSWTLVADAADYARSRADPPR
jgi:hypothetical protein